MNEPNGVAKKTLSQIRYEHAMTLAEQAAVLKDEELIRFLEDILLQGERRGLASYNEFLAVQVHQLRNGLTNGPANHIAQAMVRTAEWIQGSGNFVKWSPIILPPEGVK